MIATIARVYRDAPSRAELLRLRAKYERLRDRVADDSRRALDYDMTLMEIDAELETR